MTTIGNHHDANGSVAQMSGLSGPARPKPGRRARGAGMPALRLGSGMFASRARKRTRMAAPGPTASGPGSGTGRARCGARGPGAGKQSGYPGHAGSGPGPGAQTARSGASGLRKQTPADATMMRLRAIPLAAGQGTGAADQDCMQVTSPPGTKPSLVGGSKKQVTVRTRTPA